MATQAWTMPPAATPPDTHPPRNKELRPPFPAEMEARDARSRGRIDRQNDETGAGRRQTAVSGAILVPGAGQHVSTLQTFPGILGI